MDTLLQEKYETIMDLVDKVQDDSEELKSAVMDFSELYAELLEDLNNKDPE
jgi:hypothetical protein